MAAAKTLVAKRQFVAEIDGRNVVVIQGAQFPAASAVVSEHPEYFEPAQPTGGTKRR